jgi:hypothetical protein
MRKSGLLFFALVLCALVLAAGLRSEARAGAWLLMLGASNGLADPTDLVVKIKKKKKQPDGGNTDQQGERSCPSGYVVLDKPNKYGSFCEPKEGLPAPEAEKCKFGMIGTPPNDCHCPDGTEFAGYKGCIKVATKDVCEMVEGQLGVKGFVEKCDKMGGKVWMCPVQKNAEPGELIQYCECCTVKSYEQ